MDEAVEMKKMEDERKRKITIFKRRHESLLKKTNELALLCDVDVALIIFSPTDELIQYFSSDMTRILTKFIERLQSRQIDGEEIEPEVGVLMQAMESLVSKQRQMLVRDVSGSDREDLSVPEVEMDSRQNRVMEKKGERPSTSSQASLLNDEMKCSFAPSSIIDLDDIQRMGPLGEIFLRNKEDTWRGSTFN